MSEDPEERKRPETEGAVPPGQGSEAGERPAEVNADALYEQGMAHYRRREWPQAREAFLRLQELDPGRRGIRALLDEIDLFIRLQTLEPSRVAEGAATAEGEVSEVGRFAPLKVEKRRPWWPWAVGVVAILALVVVLVLIAPPRQNKEGEAERLWIIGQAHYNSGNYVKAVETLERLVEMGPTDFYVRASALLDQARRLRDVRLFYDRAQELKAAEQWNAAADQLQSFEEVCQRLANIPDLDLRRACQEAGDEIPLLRGLAERSALYQRGKSAYAAQDWAAAAEAFWQLQQLDREYRRDEVRNYLFAAYVNYGTHLLEAFGHDPGRVGLAVDLFERAAALRPEDAGPRQEANLARDYLIALQAFSQSNWESVRALLEPLTQERPAYAGGRALELLCRAHLGLGDAAYEKGDLASALVFYRKVIQAEGCDHAEAELKEQRAFSTLYPATPTPTVTSTPTPTPTRTYTPLPTSTPTDTPTALPPTRTATATRTPRPTDTRVPPTLTPTRTYTPVPPTNTPLPPTNTPPPPPTPTPVPPTNTPVPPTPTPLPPTDTPVPPTPTRPIRSPAP